MHLGLHVMYMYSKYSWHSGQQSIISCFDAFSNLARHASEEALYYIHVCYEEVLLYHGTCTGVEISTPVTPVLPTGGLCFFHRHLNP